MPEQWIPTVEGRYGPDASRTFREAGVWGDDDSLTEWVDHWATTSPQRRAITDGTQDLDYGTLRTRAYRVAAWLRGAGVQAGDRVAVQLPNWAEFLVTYLAVARIGAVTVPIMTVYRHGEVRHILANSGARVVVTTGPFRDFDHAAMFRELLAELPTPTRLVVARAEVQAGEVAFEALVADPGVGSGSSEGGEGGGAAGVVDLGPHAPADAPHVVIYSSGTESTAKGCLHTWNTLAFTARALAHEVFEMTEADTMYMPSPVAHSTGIVIGLVTPILAGSSIHVQDVWDPAEGLRRIERYGCTITATATPFVTMALQAAATSDADLSSMRAWLCAGAPIPGSLAREFEDTFTRARLLPLYGCTEVLMATVCRLDDDIERIAGSDGTPISSAVTLELVDDEGTVVGPGTVGEIRYRGPGAILGYWGDRERTDAAIDAAGWHHCGDLGRMDEDGYLRITGRVKDIIIRGGQNLSALEIEGHLVSHPHIAQAAVVSFPDARLGEKVCAFVVPTGEPPSLDEIRDYLVGTRGIAIQKVPERLEVVSELPMTATGKVQKFVLREIVRDGTGAPDRTASTSAGAPA